MHFPLVLGDPDLLARVIDNLIFNALEHTPRNGRVALGWEFKEGEVRITLRDSGPGIPPEQRETIF